MDKALKDKSKFLALVLRHQPEKIGITLDKNGWADVSALGAHFSPDELRAIVSDNEKKRYEFDASGLRIRAVQGHSVDVDVELEKLRPPHTLYHGTKEEFLPAIRKGGLQKMNRLHVHLSEDVDTAKLVADRRKGKSVILVIDAMQMHAKNFKFYRSKNGVWLADAIPYEFITVK